MIAILFNLLFNLHLHIKKINYWLNEYSDNTNMLHPFILNFYIKLTKNDVKQVNFMILRIVIYSVIHYLPILVLLFTQLKFSKYHNFSMTLWHFLVFLFDIVLLNIYFKHIVHPNNVDDDDTNYSKPNILSGKLQLLCSIWKLIQQRLNWKALFTSILILISCLNILIFFMPLSILVNYSCLQDIYPKIILKDKLLVAKEPPATLIQFFMAKGKYNETDWLDFTIGLDLENRDLCFAIFSGSKLYKANMKNAKFDGANFEKCQLQEVTAENASFRFSYFTQANIQNANLYKTEFERSNLTKADFSGSGLQSAEFRRIKFVQTNLQGCKFNFAQFNKVEFIKTKLQGTILTGVTINNSDFLGTKCQGLYFFETNINKCKIHPSTNFEGTIFINPNFTETHLQRQQIQNTFVIHNSKSENLFNSSNDTKPSEFLTSRNKLICLNKYVAIGIINQYQEEKQGQDEFYAFLKNKYSSTKNDIMKKTRSHLKKTCPTIFEDIRDQLTFNSEEN